MIIKVVDRKTREKSHFERLGRYILNAKKDDPVLFNRTAEYVVDVKGAGEKVGWYRVSNCHSDTPAVAIAEVLATQSRNKRTKSDKTYHLVVSLAHAESLTREQAADIEDTICAGLGFADHQRISAVHQDTDHFHLHIAINKIHPINFRCIEPYYPYYKLDTLAKELEIKHGLFQANRIGQGNGFAKVGELETQQQEESFLRWLHENVGEQMKATLERAHGWEDIHDLLSAHGAVIKPRGAGLTIATIDGRIGIKASSLDRKLSFKSLTDRFGEYLPPMRQQRPLRQYRLNQRKSIEASALFADYQRSRQTNYEARASAMAELRADFKDRRMKLNDRYRQRRDGVKRNTEMDNRTKRSAYHELSLERQKELAELKRREQELRHGIRGAAMAQSWSEYLTREAERGNTEALTVLRKRKSYRHKFVEALLTVESFEEARDIVKPRFQPTVLKNGKVVYRVQDGGIVFDEATAISVQQVTEAATVLALSLADERFRGKALVVEGSDGFKLQVAKLSALEGLSVRFADSTIENDRQRHLRAKALSRPRGNEKTHDRDRQGGHDSPRSFL